MDGGKEQMKWELKGKEYTELRSSQCGFVSIINKSDVLIDTSGKKSQGSSVRNFHPLLHVTSRPGRHRLREMRQPGSCEALPNDGLRVHTGREYAANVGTKMTQRMLNYRAVNYSWKWENSWLPPKRRLLTAHSIQDAAFGWCLHVRNHKNTVRTNQISEWTADTGHGCASVMSVVEHTLQQ